MFYVFFLIFQILSIKFKLSKAINYKKIKKKLLKSWNKIFKKLLYI